MKFGQLLRADLYRVLKSKLTIISLGICIIFPLLTTLMYLGMNNLGNGADLMNDMGFGYTANVLIGSAYSLSNNVGLVLPIFSAIFICQDIAGGMLRHKVIAGHSRAGIYLSHLTVAVIFNVAVITVYVLITTLYTVIAFPFKTNPDTGMEILRWAVNGTLTFVYISTVSTFFALTLKKTAPAIILTLVVSLVLSVATSIFSFLPIKEEAVRYLLYFVPTFAGNYFDLGSTTDIRTALFEMMGLGKSDPIWVIFACGIGSFLGFGALNTIGGILIFRKNDIK